MKKRLKPFFAPYHVWEDWKNGMFRSVSATEFELMKVDAVLILGDRKSCLDAMRGAVSAWPVSANVNLTNEQQNHRPWLGQAACCFAKRCTEDATRAAWGTLTDDQRQTANRLADAVFDDWLQRYECDAQLRFRWDE